MSPRVTTLVEHFEHIYLKHVRGLPIVNAALAVEAVGFREHEGHEIGALITPWFMNLVLLPGGEDWADQGQGESVSIALPGGALDFTLSRDDGLGTYLTAVLFRTVVDFPSQDIAREIATEVLARLFDEEAAKKASSSNAETISRRTLFTMIRGD